MTLIEGVQQAHKVSPMATVPLKRSWRSAHERVHVAAAMSLS